ncbi:MAG: glycoside hydrolase family 3 protein [Clostridia bacterium]|nr:glycoside hydrolase family 3 protein [Clostridia bacterium]
MNIQQAVAVSLVTLLTLASVTAFAEKNAFQAELSKMTLREKIGQLFVIRPDALDGQKMSEQLLGTDEAGAVCLTESMRSMYEEYPCGGFCLFGTNITDPEQLRAFTEELHALGAIRPFLSIDEEGGSVARIGNHPYGFDVPKIEPMGVIAESLNPQKAYDAAYAIGTYIKAFGFDVDYAPVADVNTNPDNPVIGDRAFGNNPVTAADMVIQYIRGLHDAGVLGCMKHFPGHGDTDRDTHTGYAETRKDWETLKNCEMIPFMAGIAFGCEMIMTAHIAAPNVTGTEEPSTLSPVILTEKLRGELGYDGLIVTDALEMGAIKEKYTSAEASIRCFLAGADMILLPYDYQEAFDGMVAAVQDGTIPESRVDESVIRILKMKEKLGR